jgi:hypothetical protein
MSVVRPWQGVSGPDTKYDVWVLDNHPLKELLTYDKLDIGSLRYDISHYIIDGPGSLSGFGNILGVFGDLWPAPGTGADWKFTVYVAGQNEARLYRYEWQPGNWSKHAWQLDTRQKMLQVRLVGSVETFAEDPERDKLPIKVRPRSEGGSGVSIIYGTLEGSSEIFLAYSDADKSDDQRRVPIYMGNYNGIAVDQYMLWVYGHEGFQCATHASVINAVNTEGKPRWLGHGHPNGIGGVISLSSCEDGTIVVSTPSLLAQTRYGIDFKEAAKGGRDGLVLPDKWENLGGVLNAPQVQKLPIYCLPEIKSLANSVGVPFSLTFG